MTSFGQQGIYTRADGENPLSIKMVNDILTNKVAQNIAFNPGEAILNYIKKCPHCAESMHVKTKVCSNCWYDFRKDPEGMPPKYSLQNGFAVVALVMVPIFVLATLAIGVSQDKPADAPDPQNTLQK